MALITSGKLFGLCLSSAYSNYWFINSATVNPYSVYLSGTKTMIGIHLSASDLSVSLMTLLLSADLHCTFLGNVLPVSWLLSLKTQQVFWDTHNQLMNISRIPTLWCSNSGKQREVAKRCQQTLLPGSYVTAESGILLMENMIYDDSFMNRIDGWMWGSSRPSWLVKGWQQTLVTGVWIAAGTDWF